MERASGVDKTIVEHLVSIVFCTLRLIALLGFNIFEIGFLDLLPLVLVQVRIGLDRVDEFETRGDCLFDLPNHRVAFALFGGRVASKHIRQQLLLSEVLWLAQAEHILIYMGISRRGPMRGVGSASCRPGMGLVRLSHLLVFGSQPQGCHQFQVQVVQPFV